MTVVALIPAIFGSAAVRADEAPDLSGAQLYQTFCASCHDATGTPEIKAPDLTRINTRHGGTFPTSMVRDIIDGRRLSQNNGPRHMPIWGWELYAYAGDDSARRQRADELIERLVTYLNSIQRPVMEDQRSQGKGVVVREVASVSGG